MPRRSEITMEWVKGVLDRAGYETSVKGDSVLAKHSERPNLALKIRPDLELLTISHFWGMKSPGLGRSGKILEAINKANNISWYSNFFRDDDGDLGVSSYLALTAEITEQDLQEFLKREAGRFMEILLLSGLKEFMK